MVFRRNHNCQWNSHIFGSWSAQLWGKYGIFVRFSHQHSGTKDTEAANSWNVHGQKSVPLARQTRIIYRIYRTKIKTARIVCSKNSMTIPVSGCRSRNFLGFHTALGSVPICTLPDQRIGQSTNMWNIVKLQQFKHWQWFFSWDPLAKLVSNKLWLFITYLNKS